MHLKTFFRSIDYRITEGFEPLWQCFKGCHCISSEEEDKFSASAYFRKSDSKVLVVEYWDYETDNYYRWVDSDFEQLFKDYHLQSNLDYDIACDLASWITVSEDDILEKISNAIKGKSSKMVDVEIDLPDHDIISLMTLAHENDITLNEMVERILLEVIKNESVDKIPEYDQIIDSSSVDVSSIK